MEFIRRNDVYDILDQDSRDVDSKYLESEKVINTSDAIEDISLLPSVDIVFCEHCRWSKPYHVMADNSDRLCCENLNGLDKDVMEDDFCSQGIEKE